MKLFLFFNYGASAFLNFIIGFNQNIKKFNNNIKTIFFCVRFSAVYLLTRYGVYIFIVNNKPSNKHSNHFNSKHFYPLYIHLHHTYTNTYIYYVFTMLIYHRNNTLNKITTTTTNFFLTFYYTTSSYSLQLIFKKPVSCNQIKFAQLSTWN